MYENEIYSNSETNTSGGGSPYFDYTTYPTEEARRLLRGKSPVRRNQEAESSGR